MRFGVILLAVALLATALVTALLWFPTPLVRAGLRAAGVETVVFEDLRLGPAALELSGVQIGAPPEQRLARLQIRYRLAELLRGRVESVEVEGLTLRGRLADGRLELAGLDAQGEPGEQASLDLMPWPKEVVLRAAEVELATAWGELRLPLALEVQSTDSAAEFRVEVVDGRLINDAGTLRADLTLRGQAPLGQGLSLAAIRASGEASVAAQSFAVPQLAEGIDGQRRGEARACRRPPRGQDRTGPRSQSGRSHPGWQRSPSRCRYPGRSRSATPHRRCTSAASSPARPSRSRSTARSASPPRVRPGSGPSWRRGSGSRMAGSPRSRARRASRSSSCIGRKRCWNAAGSSCRAKARPPTGRGRSRSISQVAVSRRLSSRCAVLALRHRLTAAFADRRLTLAAREAGALTIDQAEWHGRGGAGPMTWRLEPDALPLVAASFAADGGLAWQHDLAAKSEAFDVTLRAATPLRARAEAADLTLALTGDQSGLRAGRIALAGGRLRLPDSEITLAGIATEVALAAGGLAPDQAIPLTIATVSHGGAPGWFAPLAFSSTVRPGADAIAFDARLSRAEDGLALTVRGRHDPKDGQGRAEVELAPLVFAQGERQPGRLAPLLGDLLADVTGTVALEGTLGWGAGAGVAADLALLVEDLAFTTGPARFAKVNGVVAIDRLWPLTTPPGQQLAIGLLDLGLPLTSGLIAFQLLPDPALAVERLRWSFAGGTVSAAPFRIGSAAPDIMATLSAERLDLAQLFALTRLDGLSGEGKIRGTLPLRITGTEAVIEGGELRADGPGWLRYRPAAAPTALEAGGENVTLLLQALENFRYEALRITLDGRTDATMDIGLHVQGANPELYDGYPIEFNLDLEGELANILRSGLASYQIPERIREQMQGFRR